MSVVRAMAIGLALATVTAGTAAASSPPSGIPLLSTDGKWSVLYSRHNGYGRLDATQRASGKRYRLYRSNDSCCDEINWIRPHLLIFVDDYNVKTIDPGTRLVRRIAGFSTYVVAPNGRLIAGYADCGGHCAERVVVVPAIGGQCRAVPHRPDQDDTVATFTPDGRHLVIERQHFDLKLGYRQGPTKEVIVALTELRRVATC